MAKVDSLRQYIFGERFRLRSRLSEQECRRRIEEISRASSLFFPDVDGEPAVTWKLLFGKKRIYAFYPATRRSPWLRGTFWSEGAHTIIAGRSGADFFTLTGAGFLELAVLYGAWGEPTLWFAAFATLPLLYYVMRRSSSHGERLIDFVQGLLEADDVLARPGDPIVR